MSQRANLELVENLRPWIYKIIGDYLGNIPTIGPCACTAGDNIEITNGIISLKSNVVIRGRLDIPGGSSLVMWDDVLGQYLELSMNNGALQATSSDYVPPGDKDPGSGCISGKNITVSGGTVNLDADVSIENSISFPEGTTLKMWDYGLDAYVVTRIDDGFLSMELAPDIVDPVPPPDDSDCISGNNTFVESNVVNLSEIVIIENTIAIPQNSSLKMWDNVREQFANVYMRGGFMQATYV